MELSFDPRERCLTVTEVADRLNINTDTRAPPLSERARRHRALHSPQGEAPVPHTSHP